MPWKETSVMDERMKFVGRLLSGEKMPPLCKEFGISRVTGHKIWNRFSKTALEVFIIVVEPRTNIPIKFLPPVLEC
jgi:hypothetical protein